MLLCTVMYSCIAEHWFKPPMKVSERTKAVTHHFSTCMLRLGVIRVFVLLCVFVCERAILSWCPKTWLFTTFFLWTSLQFIFCNTNFAVNKTYMYIYCMPTTTSIVKWETYLFYWLIYFIKTDIKREVGLI